MKKEIYNYCCSCGIEKTPDEFKNCNRCYKKFEKGELFTYCNICNRSYDTPSIYMTCFDCYKMMLRKNGKL